MKGRTGFTLIEVALACALAALLMVGVLAVFTGIARDRARLAAAARTEPANTSQLINVLIRDLASADRIQHDQINSVVLQTSSCLDERRWTYVDRPALVRYQLTDENGMHCLFRRQQTLDDLVPSKPTIELLAMGVKTLTVDPIQSSNRVRIKIEFDDPSASVDRVFQLH